MKRLIKVAIIITVIIMLIPIPMRYKDGGTVNYQAILYSIKDYHAFRGIAGYDTGVEIKILGVTVYKNIRFSQ